MLDDAKLYLKHLAVGTPLESPLRFAQYKLDQRRRHKTPGLENLAEEDHWLDQIIDRTVQPGDHCLDVGGHLGSMAAMLLKRVGPEGRVDVVEPDPQKATWLQRKFPAAHVHQVALADQPGEATFFINQAKRGFSGLRAHGKDQADTHDQGFTKLTVPVQTLDQLHGPDRPLKLIKMDIEGAERVALQGAVQTLTRCQPTVLFECTQTGMDTYGYTSDDMFDFFSDVLRYDILMLQDHLAGLENPGQTPTPMTRPEFAEAHTFPWRAYNYVGRPKG